jgi:hypothetical protein
MAVAMKFESLLERAGGAFADTALAKVLDGVPSLTPEGPWLGGGALRRTLLGEQPESDFDFFFASADQFDAFAGVIQSEGGRLVAETEHHQTYLLTIAEKTRALQLIRFKFYTSAEDVINSFDYTICQFAFDGQTLTMGDLSLWDLARKRLVLNVITYPVSTLRRLLKYQRQGYFACSGCLTSILQQTAQSPELLAQLDIAYVD